MTPLINKHSNDSEDSTYDDSDFEPQELVQDMEYFSDGHHITSDSDDSYSEYETDSEFIVTGFPDEENDDEGVQQECGSESSDDLEEVDGADQEHEVEDGEDDSDLGERDGDLGEDESDLDEENNDLEEDAEQNSGSEDDAPESVSFESGKKNVLKRAADFMLQIAKDKKEIKIKRQKKDDLYKSQKMIKAERIMNDNKLPECLLEDIASTSNTMMEDSSDSEMDQESDMGDYECSENEDFHDDDEIENGNAIKAVTLHDVNKITQNKMEELLKLRQNRFGGKYNIRMSNKNKKAQIEKRKAR